MRRLSSLAPLAVLLLVLPAAASAQTGPAHGSLVIVGGNMHDQAIVERFLDLAGGTDAPVVVIPTASGEDRYDQYWSGLRPFKQAGATNLTVLHTTDRQVADSEAFVRPLTTARAVWFGGGRQWRLADAYLNTRTQREIEGVLARGGVVGGSSAGATIIGSFMVRGDTKGNEIMMGDHQVAFGLLKGVAIDQHLLRRNREFDLIPVIEAHPDLLGIGIDENTAIVVQGNRFEVMGQGSVAIYDHQKMLDSGGRFYFLAPGDRYDLSTREATRPATSQQPIGRVVKKEWGG
jgi:cyanophycinase